MASPVSPRNTQEIACNITPPVVSSSMAPPRSRHRSPPISIPQVIASSIAPSRSRPLSMALANTIDQSLPITPSYPLGQSPTWSQTYSYLDPSPPAIPSPMYPQDPWQWTIPNSPMVPGNVTRVPSGDGGNSPFSMDTNPFAQPSPEEENSQSQLLAPQPQPYLGSVPHELEGQAEERVNQTRDDAREALSGLELVRSFDRSELSFEGTEPVCITNCTTFVSYSWVSSTTISVPGHAPTFSNPEIPYPLPPVRYKPNRQISLDEQKRQLSMTDFFTALQAWPWEKPDNLCGIDLMTDERSIDLLLNYVALNYGENFTTKRYGWEIDVEFVGDTLILVEPNREQWISLDHAVSVSRIADNHRGHWRTINYEIGGMKWLVRYNAERWFNGSAGRPGGPRALAGDFVDPRKKVAAMGQNIGVTFGGRKIDPRSVIDILPHASQHANYRDLDTEMAMAPISFSSESNTSSSYFLRRYRQIAWIKQAREICWPHVWRNSLVGYQMIDPGFDNWESGNQHHLQRLMALLKAIRDTIREDREQSTSGDSKFTLRWDARDARDANNIKLYRADSNGMDITEEVKCRFWGIGEEDGKF